MDTEDNTENPAPETRTAAADVASCVIRVSDMDRSLGFYCDVFACRVVIRESDTDGCAGRRVCEALTC